jgi:hypothetical protein
MNENYFENRMMMKMVIKDNYDSLLIFSEYLHQLMLKSIVYDVIESDQNDDE